MKFKYIKERCRACLRRFVRMFDGLRIGYHNTEALREHSFGDPLRGLAHYQKMERLIIRRIEENGSLSRMEMLGICPECCEAVLECKCNPNSGGVSRPHER